MFTYLLRGRPFVCCCGRCSYQGRAYTVYWLVGVQIKSYVTATSDLWLFIHASNLLPPTPHPTLLHLQTADSHFHFWHHVWMLLAECGENISLSHTAHIKKCPDSIVGKRQRPQAFLIYSYVISMAICTWHSVLQSQHTYLSDV